MDKSNDISMKDVYTIQNTSSSQPTSLPSIDQQATHSVIDMANGQFKSNDATVPVCNLADVLPRLLKAYRKRATRILLLVTVNTIGWMTASSVSFVFATRNSTKELDKIDPYVYGTIAGVISVFSMIIIVALFCTIIHGFKWIDKVLKIIPLDGTVWQHQVNSIEIILPKKLLGLCVCNIYDQLRMHPNGCIIVTKDGFIIDELIGFRYEETLVVQLDLIYTTIHSGWIIRVFLAKSSDFKNAFPKNNYTIFQVDLFMPPLMSFDEVDNIRQMILLSSHKYLVESRFYGGPPIEPQEAR